MTAVSGRLARWSVPILCVLVIGFVLMWLRSHATPTAEAVRLRNALLFEQVAPAAAFDWVPAEVPADFAVPGNLEEGEFGAELALLRLDEMTTDEQRMLAIAAALTRHAGHPRAAMSDLRGTYQSIVDGRGYCSDFTSVFLAMAAEAGLFAREWAFSFHGFGGSGHAVVEVFDRDLQRWIFLDVFNNFRLRDSGSGQLLGVRDLRAYLLEGGNQPTFERLGPGRFGFRSESAALEYYRAGASQWYLWAGNAELRYDRNPYVKWVSKRPRAVQQLVALAVGVHPKIWIVDLPQNRGQVAALRQLRSKLLAAAGGAALAGLALAYWLVRTVSRRGREREGILGPARDQSGCPADFQRAGARTVKTAVAGRE